MSKYFNVTLILTIATGVLYIAGVAYQTGYLQELSLPPGLFNMSVHETLTTGFVVTFAGSLFVIIWALTLGFGIFMFLFVLTELSRLGITSKVYRFLRIGGKEPKARTWYAATASKFIVASACLLILWVAFLYFSGHARDSGKHAAKRVLERANGSSVLYLLNDSRKVGILQCSSSHCAIYDLVSDRIRVVPVSSIESLEIYR